MKDKLLKLLKAKQEARTAKMKLVDESNDIEELRGLQKEIEDLNEDIRSLQEMIGSTPDDPSTNEPNEPGNTNEPGNKIDGGDGDGEGSSTRTAAVNGDIPGIVVSNTQGQETRSNHSDMEARIETIAEELRSGNPVAITSEVQRYLEERAVSTSGLLIENKYKREIADHFNEVAQTIDLVDSFPLDGGNSYDVAFQITDGDADYTSEGETYTNDEGTFGTASTGRAKITNSAIVNEEVVELPNADYLTRIVNSVRRSVRKKISNQIIAGLGGANQLRGIYKAPAGTIPDTYKVEVSKIDKDTLRQIVFAYGGDEDLESETTLFLNKLDLAAFASVKARDGRPYYAITYNGASGTIQEVGGGLRVPYTINSACNALSKDDTGIGDETMVYGSPYNYELPLFTNLIIKRSDERYIDQGKVGFFGHIICGGVVNKYKGFIPVLKKD